MIECYYFYILLFLCTKNCAFAAEAKGNLVTIRALYNDEIVYFEKLFSGWEEKKNISYDAGRHIEYTCETNDPYLRLIYKKDNYEIVIIETDKRNSGHKLTINQNMADFDHETSIVCEVYDSEGAFKYKHPVNQHKTMFVWDRKTSLVSTNNEDIKPEKKKFTEGNSVKCDINAKSKSWVKLIDNKFIDTNYEPIIKNRKNLMLSTSLNRMSFLCLGYTKKKNEMIYTRNVRRLSNLIVEPSEERKPADTVTIRLTGQKTYTDLRSTTFNFREGDVLEFICTLDEMTWIHMKGPYEITKIVPTEEVWMLKMVLTMTSYDDKTVITCHGRDRNGNNIGVRHTFEWNQIRAADEKLYSDNITSVADDPKPGDILTCNGGENSINNRWILIKDNQIDTKYDNTDSITLDESDDGSSFLCTTYHKSLNEGDFTYRNMSRLINVSFGLPKQSGPDFKIYIVSAGGLLVVIIIGVLIWRAWNRRKRPRPHEVETYANPNTVLYAEIEARPSTNRPIIKEECPYAEIIGVLEPVHK